MEYIALTFDTDTYLTQVDTPEQIIAARQELRSANIEESDIWISPFSTVEEIENSEEGDVNGYRTGLKLFSDLTIEEKAMLATSAKTDAQLFVDEFSEVLNPALTDWDAVAYQEIDRDFRAQVGDLGFLFYQNALISETRQLVA